VTVFPSGRQRLAVVAALLIFAPGAGAFALVDHEPLTKPLALMLIIAAVVAEVIAARYVAALTVSGAFSCAMLAVGLVGPAAAFLVPVASFATVWLVDRYRPQALAINLAGAATPSLLAAFLFDAADPAHAGVAFYLLLAGLAVLVFALNMVITVPLMAILDGNPVVRSVRAFLALGPSMAINVAMTLALAAVYLEIGTAAIALVLAIIVAFTYMVRLLATARDRTKQYANLSWGVLSGLVRTLDERDSRAARHCAAVARFSRDIAAAVGMSKRDQELAHTAGLLHDIGKFTLSDRVMERGGRLTDADWRGIRRHPEIGAMLLKDLGVYGPVAEIVRAHHERIDGRGYPDRLTGDQIPELAKIVAVAEVYDTLTAPDTYRTPMNSFEALNELRRVAGAQLDERYVEVLAELLAGKGTEYRHADEADFDAELDIERRMNEAAAP
jgi:putative nucleotidyltransferase with HDIG domain